jgi:uncharacterized protein (TIGR02270 family)
MTPRNTSLIELYEEYLEEASFLYGQRLNLLVDADISWRKLGEFEDRFEAHIDGLVVGDQLAIEVCEAHAQGDDPGELNAAVRVFCRQGRRDLVLSVLCTLNREDRDKVQSVVDALKKELPVGWQSELRWLLRRQPSLDTIVMSILGYQRAEIAADLARAPSFSSSGALDLLWTAGRIGKAGRQLDLSRYLEHSDRAIRSAAALALLRTGDPTTVRHCTTLIGRESWASIALGLAGASSSVQVLLRSLKGSEADIDSITALGLLGEVSAVGELVKCLKVPETAAAAASSLELITGAGLTEKVFVPELIEDDELFEEERQQVRARQPAFRGDGKPFGTTVLRPSRSSVDWSTWWVENGPAFDPRTRYRHGAPYSPLTLLASLEAPHMPRAQRQLTCEELVIRYGMDIRMEADMFVSDQLAALAEIRGWLAITGGRFSEGNWYFHGSLIR